MQLGSKFYPKLRFKHIYILSLFVQLLDGASFPPLARKYRPSGLMTNLAILTYIRDKELIKKLCN